MLYREISITSTVPKKGRLDIRKFEAQEILDPDFKEGKVYRILSSNRDFNQIRFVISKNCIINDGTEIYQCTNIVYEKNPKFPILYAKHVGDFKLIA